VLDVPDAGLPGLQRSLLRAIQQRVRRLRAAYDGDDGTGGDVWNCAVVGLMSRSSRQHPAVCGVLDFTVIRQRWLRDITREVLRARRPAVTECRRYLQSAVLASSVLSGRPHGDHPDQLAAGDMTAICHAFRTVTPPKAGATYSETHRRAMLGWWRRLIDYARATGLMDTIPGTFTVRPDHLLGPVEASEDDIARAIPEEWIAHLDAHLHLLGTSSEYHPNGWTAEDLREMYRVYYQPLRDTGRRPGEIARLPDQPVEHTDGQPSLVYDNRKARRLGRRLPIDPSTATVIEQWQSRLATLHVTPERAGYLFPAPGTRNRARRGHLDGNQFRKVFVAWLTMLPTPTGLSEHAASFSVDDFEPYGLRHAYAQRHADNGTPVDVLRDLMDHREINTTMGYYRVTLARKQKAVALVAQLALDRNGSPAPFPTELAYERASVATAFGNCTEPSNVKAGGKCCPIRFQCSGCGFYRPDPSYLAAIEQQLAQLRADRAVALAADVARWVLDNLDEQIRSYDRIADTMRNQLTALPETEQHAIESACSDLRKARQSALIPVETLTRRPGD
jgi:integrase